MFRMLLLTAWLGSALPALAQETAVEWNEAAMAALSDGDLDTAVAGFRKARELRPDDPVIGLNLARALAHRGKAGLEDGRLDAAMADLEAGIAIDRDGGSLEVLVARIHLDMGRREQAQAVLESVRRDFPDNLAAARLSADVLAVTGRLDEAVELLEATHERHPDDEATRRRLKQLEEEREAWSGFLTDSSAHFDYRFDPRRPAIVQAVPKLMADLEDAYQAVDRSTGLAPKDRILVLILDRERYKVAAPAWSGGLYDGRIRLAVGDYAAERDSLRATLRHEYTHAALHRVGPRLPTWFHEGLAQWVEGRAVESARGRLGAADGLPPLEGLSGDWTAWQDSAQVLRAYDYSLSFCVWIRETFGPSAYDLLLDNVRRSGFESGFRQAFGKPLADADSEHRATLAGS